MTKNKNQENHRNKSDPDPEPIKDSQVNFNDLSHDVKKLVADFNEVTKGLASLGAEIDAEITHEEEIEKLKEKKRKKRLRSSRVQKFLETEGLSRNGNHDCTIAFLLNKIGASSVVDGGRPHWMESKKSNAKLKLIKS